MAVYPVKMLRDSNGDLFVPVVNSDAIIMPNDDTLQDLLDDKQDTLVSGTNLKTINNNSLLGSGNITISGGQATDVQINGTSIVSSNTANLRTNGTYNASTNKIATMSDLPTVNNATLTIQQNGNTVKTFTANASSNVTANITVPTKVSDLTNDSGYTTNTGTLTGFSINNTSIGTSGTININTNTAYNSSSNKIATMSDIPSVSGFITSTDYANATTAGVIKGNVNGFVVSSSNGNPSCSEKTYSEYSSLVNGYFISKGTLENVLTGKGFEASSNKVTTISSSSTNTEYPSALAVYNYINSLNGNGVSY